MIFSTTDSSHSIESDTPSPGDWNIRESGIDYPLMLLILVIALILISSTALYSGFFHIFYGQLTLVLSPYLYYSSLFLHDKNYRIKSMWVIVPYLLILGSTVIGTYLMKRYGFDSSPDGVLVCTMVLILNICLILTSFFLTRRTIINFLQYDPNFVKLIFLICFISMVILLMVSVLSLVEVFVPGVKDVFSLWHGVFAIPILLIGFSCQFLFRLMGGHVSVKKTEGVKSVTEQSGEPNDSKEDHMYTLEEVRLLEAAMEQDKLYLDSNLTLDELDKLTGIPKYKLSNIFTSHYGMGFYLFVNKYRIHYAMEIMENDPYISFDALAEFCGFNSRSTFYKYFKKVNDCTPQTFIQNLEKGYQRKDSEQ